MHFHVGIGSSWQVLVLFIMFALVACTVASTDEIEKMLCQAVTDAMHAAHLSVKEVAAYMRLDEAQLRHQLRGSPSNHLSLTRLIRLPFSFWLFFGPALIAIVYRKRLEEFAQCASDLKRGV